MFTTLNAPFAKGRKASGLVAISRREMWSMCTSDILFESASSGRWRTRRATASLWTGPPGDRASDLVAFCSIVVCTPGAGGERLGDGCHLVLKSRLAQWDWCQLSSRLRRCVVVSIVRGSKSADHELASSTWCIRFFLARWRRAALGSLPLASSSRTRCQTRSDE